MQQLRFGIFFSVFGVLLSMLTASSWASDSSGTQESAYIASEDPMADVQKGLERARAQDKLLLVVMGAQWCHDSRGLVEKFSDSRVAELLAANYETVFIDVGYFKDLRAISRRFNQAHYFATPTVMIINADNERLINRDDMSIWGSADSVPLERYLEYFEVYAANPSPNYVPLPDAQASLVLSFEQTQSERLQSAYEHLVPGMQAEDRTGAAGKEFLQQWREVWRYRSALQKDILSLRQQAQEAPDTELVFPEYPSFSWEGDS
ncbi:thioredoxin family protein [Congregibacter brevis]|uniref:Thioredoxin family protein n=1 Tax=Congregibacter brevis TaxID=3081201 RepID=A0ABZ0IG69_9GAMM|nr:thioredoxin family protein [Congregibacter sp. IMCC45268]